MLKKRKIAYAHTINEAVEELLNNKYFPRLRKEFLHVHVEQLRFIYKNDERILERLSSFRENEISVIASIVAEEHPMINCWEEEKLRYNLYYKAEREISLYKMMIAESCLGHSIERPEPIPSVDDLREKVLILERFQLKLLEKLHGPSETLEKAETFKIKINISPTEDLTKH